MGVRGLTTYVNHHQDVFLKAHNLHDGNLVIDGNSLCAQLYVHSNCFSAFGGDYDKYAAYVRKFFKALKRCNITCFVIFDGSHERRKLKTVCERLRSKIKGASMLDPVSQSSLHIFPFLFRYAFKEVLNEMKIPYTVCEFEADSEIAAMSRKLACPVLSFDSDFFIFNVMYIPFNTLDYKNVTHEKDGVKTNALKCKMFRVEYLANKIEIKPDMLPLLATLLGNDYVQKRVFQQFFFHLKLPKTTQGRNDGQRTIQALFTWIQNETLDSAIAKIIGRLKKNAKNRVLYIIKKSIEGYNCTECPSLKYFDIPREKPVNPDIEELTNELKTFAIATNNENIESETAENQENANSSDDEESSDEQDTECMPEWFSKYVRSHTIPPTYLNLFNLQTHFCVPQAENYKEEDACLCVLPILRYAFDILTDFSMESFTYVSRENHNQYTKILVGQEFATSRPTDRKYSEMPVEELKIFFQHFLTEKFPALDLELLEILPSNFRLAMLSILWWISNTNVTKGKVHSLLLSYIVLDCLDGKTGMFRGHHFFNTKFATLLEELKQRPALPTTVDETNLFLNKNKVLYEDSLIACSVLLQHFELSKEIQKKPRSYDTRVMHRFAQYQCTLLQFNCLNCISNNLFESTKYSKFFNGTFVYNLAVKLENQLDPVPFVEQYIKGAHTVILFYKSLSFVLDRCVEQLGLNYGTSGKNRRQRRGKRNDVDKNVSFLTAEFASEVFI